MNLKYNGVKTLSSSERSGLIFVGGEDGSLFVIKQREPSFTKPVSSVRTAEVPISQFEFDPISVMDYNTMRKEELKIEKVKGL